MCIIYKGNGAPAKCFLISFQFFLTARQYALEVTLGSVTGRTKWPRFFYHYRFLEMLEFSSIHSTPEIVLSGKIVSSGLVEKRRLTPIVEWAEVEKMVEQL